MLRKVQVIAALALGSFPPTSGASAQEVCPPADETSEPQDDPAITGLPWPDAREALVESGFEVEVLPGGLPDGIEDLASVVRWGVDTPFDDVNPEVAVVCLGRPVPDVFASTESAAAAALAFVGFEYTVVEGGGEQHLVAVQSPPAGTLLYLGTPVQIVLADPQVAVPDLTGLSPADAEEVLADSGLVLGSVDGDEDRPIVSQNPLAGVLVDPGGSVSVRTEPTVPTVPTSTGGTPAASATPTIESETTVNATTASTTPAAASDTPPWRTAAVAGAGATAVTALGVAGVRRRRSRWRRRITTVTTHDPPTAVIQDSQELARVTRIELTALPPIDRIEENHP